MTRATVALVCSTVGAGLGFLAGLAVCMFERRDDAEEQGGDAEGRP